MKKKRWLRLVASLGLALFVIMQIDIKISKSKEEIAKEPVQSVQEEVEKEPSQSLKEEVVKEESVKEEVRTEEIEAEVEEQKANSSNEVYYADVASILETTINPNEDYIESGKLLNIRIEKYQLYYERIDGIQPEVLELSCGERLQDTFYYYHLSGHQDVQYLIEAINDSYYLWKFRGCNNQNYSYNNILSLIYGIDSYEDISKIEIKTIHDSKTEERVSGKEISEKSQVKEFYEVLSSQICNTLDISPVNEPLQEIYLSIVTENGECIEDLRYIVSRNTFYHHNGVIFEALSLEQAQTIEDLFEIE